MFELPKVKLYLEDRLENVPCKLHRKVVSSTWIWKVSLCNSDPSLKLFESNRHQLLRKFRAPRVLSYRVHQARQQARKRAILRSRTFLSSRRNHGSSEAHLRPHRKLVCVSLRSLLEIKMQSASITNLSDLATLSISWTKCTLRVQFCKTQLSNKIKSNRPPRTHKINRDRRH